MGVENRMDHEGELFRLQAELDVLEDLYHDNVAELDRDQDNQLYWDVFRFQQDERMPSRRQWVGNLTERIFIRIGY